MNLRIRLTEERWNHIIEAHPELKEFKENLIAIIKTPDNLLFNDFTNQYIFIKSFDKFITDTLILCVRKMNDEGFIITSHPISKKRITRIMKKWKKCIRIIPEQKVLDKKKAKEHFETTGEIIKGGMSVDFKQSLTIRTS